MKHSSSHPAARAACAIALWTSIGCAAIAFGFFYCITFTRWYTLRATDFISWRNTLVLQYNFANATTGKATPLLSSTVSFLLIWQWCGTLAAALGAAGLLWLNAGDRGLAKPVPADSTSPSIAAHQAPKTRRRSLASAMKRAVAKAGRLLSLQVPPRGMWRALLGPGGLSVLDLLLILFWFGLHIMWLREMTMRTLDARRMNPPPAKAKASSAAPPSLASAPPPAPRPGDSPSPALSGNVLAPPASAGGVVRRMLLQQLGGTGQPASSTPGSSTGQLSPASAPATTVAAAAAPKPLTPLPQVVRTSISKNLGVVGRADLLLLFFPLPRCNFLHWLLGSDFPTLVKYHRWLGHGTLMIFSLHGIIYMADWSRAGTLSLMLDWGMTAGVNRLSGLVAMCGGWLIWLTCLPVIRRRLFNLFYASHILGALVFMLFGFMHRKDIAIWVMPGVFLYLLDVVLRTIQQCFNSTCVSAFATEGAPAVAKIASSGGVLTLSFKCDKSLSWVGSDIVFLNVPAVSWWQWHPFTVASSSAAGNNKLVLHIKKYNRWTQLFIARLATDSSTVRLYVSGPYHSANRRWIDSHQRHIFIAGGIGVTPALGMLHEMIGCRRAAGHQLAATARVSLVWICRTLDELKILSDEILQEANRGKDGWLDLQLYLTSSTPSSSDEDATVTGGPSPKGEQTPLPSPTATNPSKGSKVGVPGQDKVGGGADKDATDGGVKASCGSLTSTVSARMAQVAVLSAGGGAACRPLAHPYMFSPLLWMAAVVLAFTGGFAGLICAQAYDAHMSRTVKLRTDFSYVGMLQFAALGLGAALPPALLMLAVHIYRRIGARCDARVMEHCFEAPESSASSSASATAAATTVATSAPGLSCQAPGPCQLEATFKPDTPGAVSDSASDSAASVSASCGGIKAYLMRGRPDVWALMDAASMAGTAACSATATDPAGQLDAEVGQDGCCSPADESDSIGVFVAGPAPLVAAVEEACAKLNGVWGRRGRAYLDVKALTHEL